MMNYYPRVWAGRFLKETITYFVLHTPYFPLSFVSLVSPSFALSCFFSSGFWSLTYFFLLAALSFMKWDTLARKKERKNNMPKESCWKFIWIFWEPTLLFEKRNRCLEAYCKRYALWNSVKFSIHTKFVDSHFLCCLLAQCHWMESKECLWAS